MNQSGGGQHLIELIRQNLNPALLATGLAAPQPNYHSYHRLPQHQHHQHRRHLAPDLEPALALAPPTRMQLAANDQEGGEQGAALAAGAGEQAPGDWWNEYWSRQPFPSGYTQSSITLLACLITTIIFLIVVGNLLVVVAIFTEKSLKPTQNWFIASLAVSDMLLGLVVMPFSLARELMGFWVFGQLWCDIHEAIDVLLTTASINTLCLISLDRYWSITQAVNYLKKRTPRRGALMIAFVWIFSAAVSLPPLFGWKKDNPPIMAPAPAAPHRHPANHTGAAPRPEELVAPAVGTSFALSSLGLVAEEPAPASGSPSAGFTSEQQQPATTEYPSCQLSDDVGYVLYSALGSFYIPCAVMVFTYIKIFLAARSRARRAISKQANRGSGAGAGGGKRPAERRAARAAQEPQQAGEPACIQAPPKGKIVIVERRKSVAPGQQQQQLELERARAASGEPDELGKPGPNSATLTTSGAYQASPSALNSSASNDSSMITVMNTSMGELPVTRFQFHHRQPRPPARDDARAAALLEALRRAQVGADEEERRMLEEAAGGAEEEEGRAPEPQVPDIVVAARPASAGQMAPADEPKAANTTSETCFMTIEEDSDMFDAQAGRTVVIPAAAGRRSAELVACDNVHCQRRHQQATRSGSSYCGSSLTINDEDDDEAEEEDDDDEDEDEDEGHLDECELLTDDCNGYSVSCGLDQYSSCGQAHCQECEDEAAAAAAASAHIEPHHHLHQHRLAAPESPLRASRLSAQRQARHQHQGARPRPCESGLGLDDNASLAEFRSNDETSSVLGHDMLDASDERPKSAGAPPKKKHSIAQVAARPLGYLAERKMSSIGLRLARLGAGSPLTSQAGGLLDVAAAQQQQQPGSTGRNLKALRQNFFMKLNQLTAKSQAKQESKTKKSSETSPTSKLSAQSSGTSYEQSVDCATTSNVHSADYPLETTLDDGASVVVKNSSQSREAREQRLQKHSLDGQALGHEVRPGDETNRQLAGSATTDTGEQSSSNNNTNNPSRQDRSDDRVLLLTSDNNLAGQDPARANRSRLESQPQPGKRSSSSARQVNSSSLEDAGIARGGTSKSVMVKSSKQPALGNHAGSVQSAQTSTGAGQAAATSRAYLASDNERHKRKLAKARERRATLILGLIMAAFVSAWMPFFTFYVLRALCTVCRDYISPRFEAFIFWMGYCNSAINPIIYTIFNRDFRKAFRKILFKCL